MPPGKKINVVVTFIKLAHVMNLEAAKWTLCVSVKNVTQFHCSGTRWASSMINKRQLLPMSVSGDAILGQLGFQQPCGLQATFWDLSTTNHQCT